MSDNGLKSGSNIEKLFAKGEFVVTGECGPPKGADVDAVRKKAEHLKGYVDAVNITDNQTAIVRMSSIAAAKVLLDMGLEPVMQMTCRDRNRIAIQSDVFGAAALGLKNMLCLSGDHQKFGNHPEAKNVYCLDSIQLIDVVRRLRDDGQVICGDEIEGRPAMFIGAAANPFGDPFDFRVQRLAKKVEAGVDFIQTQCIYNMDKFKQWMKGVVDRGLHEKCKIMAGITPLKSVGMARYMAKNVSGIEVPEELIERMKGAPKGQKAAEGIKIAVEQMQQVREIEGVAGIHLMAIEWEARVPEIMQAAGMHPRPDPN
jgi:methylenetetrahydrofolate reductase (NADPH)